MESLDGSRKHRAVKHREKGQKEPSIYIYRVMGLDHLNHRESIGTSRCCYSRSRPGSKCDVDPLCVSKPGRILDYRLADESEDAAIWVIRSAKLLPTIQRTQGREYVLAAFNDRAVASCFHRKLTRTLSENSRFEIFLVVKFLFIWRFLEFTNFWTRTWNVKPFRYRDCWRARGDAHLLSNRSGVIAVTCPVYIYRSVHSVYATDCMAWLIILQPAADLVGSALKRRQAPH